MGSSATPIYRSRNPAKFWTKNQLKKALIMGMSTCKLPLIVIVAPYRKLYSESANWGREFKYGDTGDPPFLGREWVT